MVIKSFWWYLFKRTVFYFNSLFSLERAKPNVLEKAGKNHYIFCVQPASCSLLKFIKCFGCMLSFLTLTSPEFLKWTPPSMNPVRTIVTNRDLSPKSKQNGKLCRSWWDGSFWAVSSGSTLFAKQMFRSAGLKGLSLYKASSAHLKTKMTKI